MFFFSRDLEIHCWGGLGSQLYASAFFEKMSLENFNPTLVSHSSGVTPRSPELDWMYEGEYSSFNDFELGGLKSEIGFAKRGIISILKSLKNSLGLNLYQQNDTLPKIREWTKSVRGHYAFEQITEEILEKINERSLKSRRKEFYKKDYLQVKGIGIHYRIGDLETLVNKTYIDPSQLSKLIQEINEKEKLNVTLSSDSANKAELLLGSANKFDIRLLKTNTWDTIQELKKLTYFVGTNSKVSIWIAILRSYEVNSHKTFMPENLKPVLMANLGQKLTSKINFY